MVLQSKNLELLQAVLVCDNFNDEFRPIQSDQQLALLKIANCPLIEHSLTFLKANGIEQVIVFTSNLKEVKGYLEERNWIKENEETPFAVVRPSDSCTSLGDVMRDVFNSNLVKNDFVLLNGNVIGGNIPLVRYLKEHVDRRKNDDKGSIMTMLYSRLDFDHRSRSRENEPILMVNRDTQKMLFYDTLSNAKKKIGLQLELLRTNPTIRIHFDLQDTNISLCSISVPQLFADNFDYYTKDDLVRGILVHEEIMMNTIYIQTLDENAYAVKVNDAFSFDAVSRDIIERWSFPVVPDILEELAYHRHNVYRSSTVDLKIDSVLEQNLVIGRNTSIDSGSRIRDSVIGDNCRVGKNVRMNGCYLLDNVVVEDDCVLTQCILSRNVHVKRHCQVPEGCMLGTDCIIGPSITLRPCTLLQAKSEFDEKIDVRLVGAEGSGFAYKPDDELDDEEDGEVQRLLWGLRPVKADEKFDDSESTDEAGNDSDENEDEEDDFEGQLGDEEFKGFYREVKDSLVRGVREKVESKNLILEINGSKIAFNIPIEDVGFILAIAILGVPKKIDPNLDEEKPYFAALQVALQHCLPLFKHYVNSKDSQRDCLLALENYLLVSDNTLFSTSILIRVLNQLYDEDVLGEEAILQWYKQPQLFPEMFHQIEEEDRNSLRQNRALKTFVQWLLEAEEESSDDD